jgi:hypothetical protein
MPDLPADWRDRTGSLAQIARAEQVAIVDGPGRGSRCILVETGGGVAFKVLPDRALDFGRASFGGLPLAWLSPAGFAPGEGVGTDGTECLRGFGGGLLTTCGLDSFGPASEDSGRQYGLHGRIGREPAPMTRCEVTEARITLSAMTRQTSLFSEALRIDRTITAAVGGTALTVDEAVTNEGNDPEGHTVLYHGILGWPLIGDGARIEGPGGAPAPRAPPAEAGLSTWGMIHGPQETYPEQVFLHEAKGPEARMRLVNPRLGLALTLTRDAPTLPALFQRKYLRRRGSAFGREPVNTRAILGRAQARAAGDLPILAPGATRRHRLSIAVGAP